MAAGFSIVKFLKYIGEEILIVLGTSSSESVLPRIMAKLEYLGCAKPVVGLVVPTGYSFNLDGTAIYMTMGMMFVAQASGVDLTLGQELGMLARAPRHVQGGGGGDRQRLRDAGGDAGRVPDDPGRGPHAAAGRRPLHVRGARDHEPDWQRGRHDGHRPLGRRPGSRARARDPRRRAAARAGGRR